MPSATVADGCAPAHPSSPGDTPVINDPHVIAAMVDAYTGRSRRRFPSAEMLDAAAAYVPGLPASASASHTWTTPVTQPSLDGAIGVDVHQSDALTEGPSWYVSISPGRVRVWTRDEARYDRRQTREREMRMKAADALATFIEEGENGQLALNLKKRTPTREVTDWSAKSRCNMIGSYADLDFTEMFEDPDCLAAMLTFTYSKCWQTVAPNGKAAKRHLKNWRKKYQREFGTIRCIWKLEFQGRAQFVYRHGEKVLNWCECEGCAEFEDGRAPHFHMLVTLPTSRLVRDGRGRPVRTEDGEFVRTSITTEEFKVWLSRSWADAVDHPDPVEYAAHLGAGTRVDLSEGGKASDPRRITTYFAKHGAAKAKEYQHCVPKRWQQPGEGPGRFWGYWGLEKAVRTVPVAPEVGAEAGRIIRRHSRAQGVTRLTQRRRYKGGQVTSKYGEVIGLAGKQLVLAHTKHHRPCRTRAVRAVQGRGWAVVNDGSSMGGDLGRALSEMLEYREMIAVDARMEGITLVDRALRLPAGPRRDALVAKLEARSRKTSANG